ncbi:lipase family protein [Curvibacter lanceolatus]|uniref:lipase family protein n=1 Tax=Curvibacter lanceolatus TaxID=86182 RepID=UPI000A032245|nr:hypothetical protein [Curvibacter lanceolatus]
MGWMFFAVFSTAIVAGLTFALYGRVSFQQTRNDVYRRESGGYLQPWKTVGEASAIHWPYAWAAVASYQDSDDPKRESLEISATSPEPHAFLSQRGWVQWTEIPSLRPRLDEQYSDTAKKMRDVHLRAEVWSNEAAQQVVVAFGGTAGKNLDDWKANFRWIMIHFEHRDAYTVLTENFIPVFVEAYKERCTLPGWAWLSDATVIAAGHSLGGGLAQRFAYSLEESNEIPIVREVYAFDSSPVSGKRSSPNFPKQAAGLTIYRVYKRGEVLASLRALIRLANPGDKRNQGQKWIEIRYADNWSLRTALPLGSVRAHRMYDLAKFMARNLPKDSL